MIQLSTTEPMVEPMKPPMVAALTPRIAPPMLPPMAAPAAPRTRVAMCGVSALREQEGEGDAPPPGWGERFLDHAEPLVGVEEAVGPGQDPDMLGDGAGRMRNRTSAPGPAVAGATSIIMRRAPSASTSRGPVSPQSRL